MCRRVALCLLLAAGLLFGAPTAHAQNQNIDNISDLRGALRVLTEEYADQYVQPATDAFGAGLHGGLFRSADVGNGLIPGLPLNIYVGVNVSGAFTSGMTQRFDPQEFSPTTVDLGGGQQGRIEFVPGADDTVPTLVGETETPDAEFQLVTEGPGGTVFRQSLGPPPPGLLSAPIAPIPIPQANVGTVFGTDVQIRYFPKVNLSGYGKIGLLGVGLRHDIDQWIPVPLPLNLAVQGAWTRFSLESQNPQANTGDSGFQEVMNGSGWAVNLQASRGLPVIPLTFYGGLQYETFSMDYSYQFDPQLSGTRPINFNLSQDAANSVRALAGVTFTLAVLRFNVDYAISTHNTLTAGVGLRL